MSDQVFRIELIERDGTRRREECPAVCFVQQVGPYRFKFAVHKSRRDPMSLTLSHFRAGKRICEISAADLCEAPEATIEEHGRRALDRFIARTGLARVASVLFHAGVCDA